MNSLISAHPTGVAFRYQLKRVKLINNGSYDVEFSDALAHMLGFSVGTSYQPRNLGHTAPRTIDLSSVIVPTLYVYCDILEHVVAPLLRIVNIEVTRSHAVHQIMNPPLFVSVQKKNSDTIEMNIMIDTGEPVPFMDGKSSSFWSSNASDCCNIKECALQFPSFCDHEAQGTVLLRR